MSQTMSLSRRLLVGLCVVMGLVEVLHPPAVARPTPASPQKLPVALMGGTIHPVSGPAIEDGVLIFAEGRIVAVGPRQELEAKIPAEAQRIDVSGRHVYPGLFDGYSQLGLVEVEAVRSTRDQREVGEFKPNVKAAVSFNPETALVPVARSNGVLLALSAPVGGVISGQSAVMQLDGWTFEDMALRPAAGMHLNWPRMTPRPGSDAKSAAEQRETRDEELAELRDLFAQARQYGQALAAAEEAESPGAAVDIRLAALQPVLQKELPLIVTAETASEIQAAVAFAAAEDLRLIIYGGYEAEECAALLKEHQVPVMIGGVHRLPLYRHDLPDAPFTLAARLRKAGVACCITSSRAAWDVRNLPYHAATAAAHGLPPEDAVAAITLWPAQILGVADEVGSLEPGKRATLIVTTGNPLDVRTQTERAFVDGRAVELTDRHKELYEKYRRRLEQTGPGRGVD